MKIKSEDRGTDKTRGNDVGSKNLWNTSRPLPDYVVQQPSRQPPSKAEM
jgi:hypothetical protein